VRYSTLDEVVNAVRALREADTQHDSDIFFGGLKLCSLDRNLFYRAARGDEGALVELRSKRFDAANVVKGHAEVLDMTAEEFAEKFPVEVETTSTVKASSLGSMLANAMLYSNHDPYAPDFERGPVTMRRKRTGKLPTLDELDGNYGGR
jgi:hypothetical protein